MSQNLLDEMILLPTGLPGVAIANGRIFAILLKSA